MKLRRATHLIEHDGDVGKLLKALDDLGVANNTIVIYTTDNGPNQFSWPDAATTPFRSEKDTNWEGAFRRARDGALAGSCQGRWSIHPNFLRSRLGSRRCSQRRADSTIKDRLLKGTEIGGTTFRVHLDGYNQLDYLTGKGYDRATSTTTAILWPTVTATGKRYSRSRRGPAAFQCGMSRSPPIAYRRSSTCGWTLMSGRMLSPTSMTTGG